MIWLLISAALLGAAPVSAQPIEGSPVVGGLVSLDAERIVLSTDSGEVVMPVVDMMKLTPTEKGEVEKNDAVGIVQLVDGSSLRVVSFTVKSRVATLLLESGSEVSTSTRNIAFARFQTSPKLDQRWREILDSETEGDVIVVQREKDDGISLDYIDDGLLGDVTNTNVTFTFDGESHDVTRENKVGGLFYYHPAGRILDDALCKVTDVAGNQWRTKSCELAGDQLSITSLSGVSVELPFSQVDEIDFSEGKIAFLADLKPDSVQMTPYFDASPLEDEVAQLFHPRFNSAFDGDKLLVGGTSYERGIAVRSRTRLVYTLPGKFGVLQAVVGIDDRAGDQGHVRLVISGDGETLLSEEVKSGDKPLPLKLDIEGYQRLSIFVDYGDNFGYQDHLDLCDITVKK